MFDREFSIWMPADLTGLTLGQVVRFLGFDYRVTSFVIMPPRYKGKRLTKRARRWWLRHWYTVETQMTLTPMGPTDA